MHKQLQRWAREPRFELSEDEDVILMDEYAAWYPYYPIPIFYIGDLYITNWRVGFAYRDLALFGHGTHRRWAYERSQFIAAQTIHTCWIYRIGVPYSRSPMLRLTLDDTSTIEINSHFGEQILEELTG